MMKIEEIKRPRGVIALVLMTIFDSLVNLFTSVTSINTGLSIWSRIPEVPAWFQICIPVELGLNVVVFGCGLAQAFIVYGLWTRKHWSSSLLLKVIAIAAIVNLAGVLLYSSYPQELVAQFGPMPLTDTMVNFIVGIIWFFVCRWYTAKQHVKEYLGQIL